MNIGDYLIWEATNGLLLIPVVLGLVILTRWVRGRPVFTERDWLFLFGHSRNEVFSLRLLLRFCALFLLVVLLGLAICFYVLPYGLGWFAGAVLLTIAGILLVVPRWLR
jgi:hypothetical protein